MIRCADVKGLMGRIAVVSAGVVERRRLLGFVRQGFMSTCFSSLNNIETHLSSTPHFVERPEY